jgi:flagella basal body P-ring formation protein FlgA
MGEVMARALIGVAVIGMAIELLVVPCLVLAGQATAPPAHPGTVQLSKKGPSGLGTIRRTAEPAPAASKPATQDVTEEQIRLTLQRYVEKRFEGKVEDVQVQVLNLAEPVTVPAGLLEVRVIARGLEEGLGRRLFQIELSVDGTHIQTLKVMADVAASADVVTAVHYLKPEETIQAEDLKVARIQLPALVHDFALDPEAVVGKRVVRPVRAEAPVRMSALSVPFVVKRGDQVTIEVKHGGLLIQASGTTKASGQLGQSITVTNLDSGKEIRGKVVGPGVVRVGF